MFTLNVAVRFLLKSRLQTFFIASGIAIGVGVLVFVGALITGLQEDLIDTTIGNSAHITVLDEKRNERFEADETLLANIISTDERIIAASRVIESGSAFIDSGDTTDPVLFRGVIFDDANAIYQFDEKLVDGNLPSSNDEVIIGVTLASFLEVSVGDPIDVTVPSGFPPANETYTVSGIFDFGSAQVNTRWVVASLTAGQSLLETHGVDAIEFQVSDVFMSDAIASALQTKLGDNYRVEEWQQSNQELLSGLEGQSISGIMIQAFVLVSVVLGIASVLAISVMQKSSQLGILKAMGATDQQSSLIFLFQGIILGLLGAVFGVIIGIALSTGFTMFALNPDGTPILEIIVRIEMVIFSAFIAVLASMIASLIPARRSARLSVIEVIRNG